MSEDKSSWDSAAWRTNPAVIMLTPLSRGLWFEAINYMMEQDTCDLTVTPEQLAAVCRCDVPKAMAMVAELRNLNVCDVQQAESSIKLLWRERHNQLQTSEIKRRAGRLGGKQTQSNRANLLLRGYSSSLFLSFWNYYPRKVAKGQAALAWSQNEGDKYATEILAALKWQKELPDWLKEKGVYVPYPATYLRGHRWEDEQPPEQPKPRSYAP